MDSHATPLHAHPQRLKIYKAYPWIGDRIMLASEWDLEAPIFVYRDMAHLRSQIPKLAKNRGILVIP